MVNYNEDTFNFDDDESTGTAAQIPIMLKEMEEICMTVSAVFCAEFIEPFD